MKNVASALDETLSLEEAGNPAALRTALQAGLTALAEGRFIEIETDDLGAFFDNLSSELECPELAFVAGVRRGLEAADAGRTVPYETVRRWLSSWGGEFEIPPPECLLKGQGSGNRP